MDDPILIVVDKLIKTLKQRGFVIQRYNAMTSRSVYLKLDYGVAHSIRISDHPGKAHLKYRYNLLSRMKGIRRTRTAQGWPQYYYGFSSIENMLHDICTAREERINAIGLEGYEQQMAVKKEENKNSPGFWSKCVEV